MFEYRFAKPEEMPQVIDFIDLVFSQLAIPHDFEKLLPKVYGEGHDFSDIHAIALNEAGSVRGCVGVYPYPLTVAGETLSVGYVGSVSVHRSDRGAGHMKQLMHMQLERAKEQGVDVLLLGGQRQRYAYYGFAPVGGMYRYSVGSSNLRHALKDVDASPIAFSVLEDGAYAYDLYQQQPVCGARTAENFIESAYSFKCTPWLITFNGEKAGYLVASNTLSEIHELVLEDKALISAVIKAWMTTHQQKNLSVIVSTFDTVMNRTLAAYAEWYSLGQSELMCCLNYEKMIRAWMKLKNSVTPLSDGTVRLAVEEDGVVGKTIEVSVSGGEVAVATVDAPADVVLSPMDMSKLLFCFNRFYAPETDCAIPGDWLPLPLFLPTPDHF